MQRFAGFIFMLVFIGHAPLMANEKLKIGLLYTGDSYPIVYAQNAKLYGGVEVEIVNFMSAVERDSALMSGKIDGMNADLIGTSLLHQAGVGVQVVAQSLSRPIHRLMAIVSKDFKLNQLTGKKLAISPNTIIEYLADRLLSQAGVDIKTVNFTTVPNIPLRMQLASEGKIDAAVLPEPLASMAQLKGAQVLADDKGTFYAHAVLAFHKDALHKKSEAIKKFMQGFAASVAEINKDIEKHRQGIAERCRVPDAVKNSFMLYQFANQLPEPTLFNDVHEWLLSKEKIKKPIAYQELIDSRFIFAPSA